MANQRKFYEETYLREIAPADSQLNRLTFPFTVAALLAAGLWFIWSQIHVNPTHPFFYWWCFIFALATGITLIVAIFFFIRAAYPQKIRPLPSPKEIQEYQAKRLAYENEQPGTGTPEERTDYEVDSWLTECYQDSAQRHCKRNNNRSSQLAHSFTWLSFSAIGLLITGAGFFLQTALMPPKQTQNKGPTIMADDQQPQKPQDQAPPPPPRPVPQDVFEGGRDLPRPQSLPKPEPKQQD